MDQNSINPDAERLEAALEALRAGHSAPDLAAGLPAELAAALLAADRLGSTARPGHAQAGPGFVRALEDQLRADLRLGLGPTRPAGRGLAARAALVALLTALGLGSATAPRPVAPPREAAVASRAAIVRSTDATVDRSGAAGSGPSSPAGVPELGPPAAAVPARAADLAPTAGLRPAPRVAAPAPAVEPAEPAEPAEPVVAPVAPADAPADVAQDEDDAPAEPAAPAEDEGAAEPTARPEAPPERTPDAEPEP